MRSALFGCALVAACASSPRGASTISRFDAPQMFAIAEELPRRPDAVELAEFKGRTIQDWLLAIAEEVEATWIARFRWENPGYCASALHAPYSLSSTRLTAIVGARVALEADDGRTRALRVTVRFVSDDFARWFARAWVEGEGRRVAVHIAAYLLRGMSDHGGLTTSASELSEALGEWLIGSVVVAQRGSSIDLTVREGARLVGLLGMMAAASSRSLAPDGGRE